MSPVLEDYLVIALGAAIGGVLRYAIGSEIMAHYGGRFPLGTLIVNITGCFLIGVAMAVLTERLNPHPHWRRFLVVGVLGGFTTFSSFAWETYTEVRAGSLRTGLLNVTASVVLGYFGVWLGAVLAAKR